MMMARSPRVLLAEDIRWTCERLVKLTPKRWENAVRAAAYDEATAGRFIRRLQAKVEEGLRLQ